MHYAIFDSTGNLVESRNERPCRQTGSLVAFRERAGARRSA
jgi:hypothetical protein